MTSAQELVAIFDAQGNHTGHATRARMRAEGLWHASTGILVRSLDGRRIYVHRRTDTKDVYPGLYDCCAGGVLAAGEDPDTGAARELAEELGVRDVPLRPLFQTRFDEGYVRYHAYLYEVRTDGPFTHQPEEVAWGGWMDVDEVRYRVADPEWPMVPDGRAFIQEWFARGLGD